MATGFSQNPSLNAAFACSVYKHKGIVTGVLSSLIILKEGK
jgi:hypothetical protein